MKQHNYLMNGIFGFASAFGVEPINIDELESKKQFKLKIDVNKKKYLRFIKNYIGYKKNKKNSSIVLERYLNKIISKY